MAVVAAVLELESLAKAPAYKDLAAGVRGHVLAALDQAASPGACLCSEGPNVSARVGALVGARGRGRRWAPFADAAFKVMAAMRDPKHFTVLDPAGTSCGSAFPSRSSETTRP